MKFFEHESSTSWIKKKISWEFTKNYFIQVRNSQKTIPFTHTKNMLIVMNNNSSTTLDMTMLVCGILNDFDKLLSIYFISLSLETFQSYFSK